MKRVAVVSELPEADELPVPASRAEARIAELAKLKPLEYERSRETEAKALKTRISVLDQLVEAARQNHAQADQVDPFEAVEPWDRPVDGAALLNEIRATIERFCVLSRHDALLMAVWVLHAWTHDVADISPILALVSPVKRCGKTTALNVISVLAPRAMPAVNISASVLFRVVEKYAPTVLIDEGDTFLTADRNNDMLGMLNGGHNRAIAYVWRSAGDDHEPRRYTVWAPKVIAMIGKLPDTLEDRSLVIHLRRKQAGETVERFRADRVNDFLSLRGKSARWARDNALCLRDADPDVPEELNDRAQDNARAICAIADTVGGHWPHTIRTALVASVGQADDDPQSPGVLLLPDIAKLLQTRRGKRIGSSELCEALCALEDGPWAEWRGGKPLTTRGIVRLLRPFGVNPVRDRDGSFYRPEDFSDALNRYVPGEVDKPVTSTTSVTGGESAEKIHNVINVICTCGTCGTCSERQGDKRHDGGSHDDWEGVI